jgi:alkaline phosphatase D
MRLPRRVLLQAALSVPLTVPLSAPLFVRHARAADTERFALGVASGQPQAHTVVLWTRITGANLPPEVDVIWQIAEDEAFGRIVATGTEKALAADAHSVHAEPQALLPARGYWYRFMALGQRSPVGRTRTAPAPQDSVKAFSFAIASCQRYDTGRWAAWRDLASNPPEVLMFLGDYIYEYASGPAALRPHHGGLVRALDDYRERYAQYKSDALLQAAHAACPWLLVWDDHEVDNDYAGQQGQSLQPHFAAQRAAAYQAYWEHMPLPKAARPADGQMRMFGRVDWGTLARIHLLDDRQYRDPQACPRPGRGGSNTVRFADCETLADPRRSLLGSTQEQWLAEGWALDRPWNLLAQQTLMSRFAWADPSASDGGLYWTDGWDGYPAARQRLLAPLAAKKVPGVVVLGGDVHANYVAEVLANFNDPKSAILATEFCGTSISSLGLPQTRVDAALPFNPHIKWGRADQRGYQRFVLNASALTAELRVVEDPLSDASVVQTAARFVVSAKQPGAQRL